MQVAEQPEPGHVGERVRAGAASAAAAAARLSVVITVDRLGERGAGQPALGRRRDRAGAERLGQHERVAGAPAGVA